MADDGLVLVLARLDEPVAVRPAFADALRRSLYAELGFPVPTLATTAAVPQMRVAVTLAPERRPFLERLRRVSRPMTLRPMTPRLALLILVALLLIACTVAGAWVVIRGWVSTGPRGAQYTNDFVWRPVYELRNIWLENLVTGPDGATLYAVRHESPRDVAPKARVIRLVPTATGDLSATDVLELESLRDPALWPSGADLSTGMVAMAGTYGDGRALSLAPNGDMFLSIGLQAENKFSVTTLVVVHPDGRIERVLSVDDLGEDGPLERVTSGAINVAASAPDVLWAHVDDWAGGGSMALYEAIDPNADGTWTDAIVRPLVLPAEVPALTPDWAWWYGSFVAEPSTPGHDRRSSALLPVWSSGGEYRIYRIADPDRDGDATDPGETELVVTARILDPGNPPRNVTRRVVADAEPPIDEILVAGLTRQGRISRVTPGGTVDIVRSLTSVFGMAATSDGAIYITDWGYEGGADGTWTVYRLTPLGAGATQPPPATLAPASGESTQPPAPTVGPSLLPRRALTDGVQRIAVSYGGTKAGAGMPDDWLSELVFVGADGSGPASIVADERAEVVCPQTDGDRVAFWSDQEVPNEGYLYVANVGGGDRILVTETASMLVCPFPAEAIAYLRTGATPWSLTWHPFSGQERELVSDVVSEGLLGATSDGRLVALATGTDGRDVTVVDVVRGERRVVVTGLAGRVRVASWSADGSGLAVATGPWDPMNPGASGRFTLWLVDPAGGAPRHLAEVDGSVPGLTWSSDGKSIAILAHNGAEWAMSNLGDLFVVDVATGQRRHVAPDAGFAEWSPVDPNLFAYATDTTLVLETNGVVTRRVPGPTGKLCSTCSDRPTPRWPGFALGWSPDGRYIGTGETIIGVVDVKTGEYRVLLTDGDEELVLSARWWPTAP